MRTLVALGVCLCLGPCIVISPSRNFWVTGDNPVVTTTVTKDEKIDSRLEGSITGIEATATATANVNAGKVSAK